LLDSEQLGEKVSIAIFGCASRRRPQFKRLHKYLLDMDRIEVISDERPTYIQKARPESIQMEALKRYRTGVKLNLVTIEAT
jgi:hypothetical protein